MANPDFDGGSIRIIKRGPEDYHAYMEDFQYGSSSDAGGETIAETLNRAFEWFGLDITVTIG
jgi:hypothetical protein